MPHDLPPDDPVGQKLREHAEMLNRVVPHLGWWLVVGSAPDRRVSVQPRQGSML